MNVDLEKVEFMKAPVPKTLNDLYEFLDGLLHMDVDDTNVYYTISLGAAATFNFLAEAYKATDLERGVADMDILRHTRGFHRGQILDYEYLMYPQYVRGEHWPIIIRNRKEFAERAEVLLQGTAPDERTKTHWEYLRAMGE